jgi:hypothetical protein
VELTNKNGNFCPLKICRSQIFALTSCNIIRKLSRLGNVGRPSWLHMGQHLELKYTKMEKLINMNVIAWENVTKNDIVTK